MRTAAEMQGANSSRVRIFVPSWLVFALAALLLLAQPARAAEGVRGNLVDVHWLNNNLKNPNVLILDASAAQAYAAAHIPGAINAPPAMVNTPYGLQQAAGGPDLEKLYQSASVSLGKKLVLYDQGGAYLATRLFFSLYYHGFPAKDLFILDGGLAKWQEKGLAVSKETVPAPKPGSFKITAVKEDVRGVLPEVLTASGDPEHSILVDALGPDWHFGQVAPFVQAGHIPHSVLLPAEDFFNPDKTFKSAADIRKMLSYAGVKPEQQIYTYCGGGIAASVPFFAIKFIADYPKVKLFTASEMGWLHDDRQLPFWTFDAPYLMRDTKWLQFWGGQMLRMYAGSEVSIVDVRPAEAFNEGHVPFALNIPAEVFRGNLAHPEKLAEMLGPAGVDASHEAVVVSGAGLTRESALAFAMLETLGQRKVSVLIDPAEAWAKSGMRVTKDATVVRPKSAPNDVAIPPTTYTANRRHDVTIGDVKTAAGAYPKVFIASGAAVPSRQGEEKVVHVPYTDLLNPDGTPKPAKEIWKILSKAGVPRYAELVCFSDDPGEAAVNYFVLKLMGYPEVKVQLM